MLRDEGREVLDERLAAYVGVECGHVVMQMQVEQQVRLQPLECLEARGVARVVKVVHDLAHLQRGAKRECSGVRRGGAGRGCGAGGGGGAMRVQRRRCGGCVEGVR